MKSVSESLAGRAAYLSLWPMTRRERLGQGRAGLWSELPDHPCEQWPEILNATDPEPGDWRQTVREGGYPVPAVEYTDRTIWWDGYIRTYLERDLVAGSPDPGGAVVEGDLTWRLPHLLEHDLREGRRTGDERRGRAPKRAGPAVFRGLPTSRL